MKLRLFLTGITILLLLLYGCNATESVSDDSTKEAKTEQGLTALDESNYSKAEEIFTKLNSDYPDDDQIKGYLSSAFAGGAGLDTLNLLQTLDGLNDSPNRSDTIELVGRTLTGITVDSPQINLEDLNKKITKLEEAMDALLNITDNNYLNLTAKYPSSRTISSIIPDIAYEELTNDELVQLGLISLNHSVLLLAKAVFDDLSTKIPEFDNRIILSETWLRNIYESYSDFSLENISSIRVDDLLKKLSLDIEIISKAVEALNKIVDGGNDIEDEFDEFIGKLDLNSDGTITEPELNNYINSL